MKRYIIVGLLVLLVVFVSLAPASLLKGPLSQAPGLRVSGLSGTLWSGSGYVTVQGQELGRLNWSFDPAQLLSARAALRYMLMGPAIEVRGIAGRSISTWQLSADGQVGAELVNQALAPYEIRMTGDLTLDGVEVALAGRVPEELRGQVLWPGGPVSYPDVRGIATRPLPPLRADLSLDDQNQALASVHSESINFPLITMRALNTGFAKISLTRRFTQIVGMPWPGSEPDHAFVLEVEQQVF